MRGHFAVRFWVSMPALITNLSFRSIEEMKKVTPPWNLVQIQLGSGIFQGSMFSVAFPECQLSYRDNNLPFLEYKNAPMDILTFYFPSPAGEVSIGGVADNADTQFVFGRDTTSLCGVYGSNARMLAFRISDTCLEHFGGHDVSAMSATMRDFTDHGLTNVCPARKRSFCQKVETMISHYRQELKPAEALEHELKSDLALTAIDYLRHIREKGPVRIGSARRRQRIFNKALEFIHNKSVHEITINDIADNCATSLRNLEYVFRNKLNETPKSYLMKVRMITIRQELIMARNSGDKITEIVQKYGISNHGRFSAEYYEFFGEYPRDTYTGSAITA